MEELLENYHNATENDLPTSFNYNDFFNFGLITNGFSETEKIKVIRQYAKEKGYIKIKGNFVTLTKKGIHEAHKQTHDWDTRS